VNQSSIGIDCRDEYYYTARVSTVDERCEIQTLARFKKEHLKGHQYLQGNQITFCLPDKEVQVKILHLKNSNISDLDALVRFEMSQLMLDDESDFDFSYLTTGDNGRYLGLGYRKSFREELLRHYGFDDSDAVAAMVQIKMRAVALGEGLLKFCHFSPGELVCLVDFNGTVISICFLYQGHIIDLAYMVLDKSNLSEERAKKTFAANFKTLVNFRTGLLFREGVTVPLAALIVTGDKIEEQLKKELEKYFPVGIRKPRIIQEYLPGPAESDEISLEKYLVALGLAVN